MSLTVHFVGRVESNGELLCSYHAWTFNGKGECTSIPQTLSPEKEASLLPRACVASYPTQVRQGLIWVWGTKGLPGSDVAILAALKSPQLIDELEDPETASRLYPQQWNFRDLPYGWDFFMENVFDPAHVPVSHHKTRTNRQSDALLMAMKRATSITEIPFSQGGKLIAGHEEDAGFKYSSFSYRNGVMERQADNDFRPPSYYEIDNVSTDVKIVSFATPTRPGFCRFFSKMVIYKDKGTKEALMTGRVSSLFPAWLLHQLSSLFLVESI